MVISRTPNFGKSLGIPSGAGGRWTLRGAVLDQREPKLFLIIKMLIGGQSIADVPGAHHDKTHGIAPRIVAALESDEQGKRLAHYGFIGINHRDIWIGNETHLDDGGG